MKKRPKSYLESERKKNGNNVNHYMQAAELVADALDLSLKAERLTQMMEGQPMAFLKQIEDDSIKTCNSTRSFLSQHIKAQSPEAKTKSGIKKKKSVSIANSKKKSVSDIRSTPQSPQEDFLMPQPDNKKLITRLS